MTATTGDGPAGQGGVLRVEVCRVDETARARLVVLSLPAGACVEDAVRASGFMGEGMAGLEGLTLAIFGRRVGGQRLLADADRVEILPAVLIDPKRARAERVAARRPGRSRKL